MDNKIQEKLYELAFGENYTPEDKELFRLMGKHYAAGSSVFSEGDAAAYIYLIIRGSVKIVKNIGNKEEKAIAVLTAGEIFGEMSFFDDLPRSAAAVAVLDTDLLALDKDQFEMVFNLHPKWTVKLIKSMAERIYLTYFDLENDTSSLMYI